MEIARCEGLEAAVRRVRSAVETNAPGSQSWLLLHVFLVPRELTLVHDAANAKVRYLAAP